MILSTYNVNEIAEKQAQKSATNWLIKIKSSDYSYFLSLL